MRKTSKHEKSRPATEGTVLDEFRDMTPPMPVVYYKGGYDFACSNLPALPGLLFACCHSTFHVTTRTEDMEADALSVLVLPSDAAPVIKAVTAVSHVAVLYPSASLISKTAKIHNIPPKKLAAMFARPRRIKRTNWLNEIMHRYIFERVDAGSKANEATAFLETEIIKEVYYLGRLFEPAKNVFNLDRTDLYNNLPIIKRTLSFIETHLFDEITMDDLVKNSFASEATLLRVFSKEFKKTPFAYIADRRLEESLVLLRGRKYSISEIADNVGYQTVSGFIAAFKKRFKLTPLAWRNQK
jgi:AraC-like DNA-binding protein